MQDKTFFKVLLDSGSMTALINMSSLPKVVQGKKLGEPKDMLTLVEHMTATIMVKLRDLRLLQFDKNISTKEHKVLVFDTPC